MHQQANDERPNVPYLQPDDDADVGHDDVDRPKKSQEGGDGARRRELNKVVVFASSPLAGARRARYVAAHIATDDSGHCAFVTTFASRQPTVLGTTNARLASPGALPVREHSIRASDGML